MVVVKTNKKIMHLLRTSGIFQCYKKEFIRILRGTMLRDSTPQSKVILHNLQVAFYDLCNFQRYTCWWKINCSKEILAYIELMKILQFVNQWKFTHNNISLYLVYIFIRNTINHITRAGMLIDSRTITLIFSFIFDMMDWPSKNKKLQNKRGPPLKNLSNNKCIY